MKRIALFLVTLLVAGCGEKSNVEKSNVEKSAIIGKWIIRETAGVKSVSDNNWYEFMDDGNCNQATLGSIYPSTWKLEGDALTITLLADPSDPDDFDIPFTYVIKSIEDNRMVLKIGDAGEIVLEKE